MVQNFLSIRPQAKWRRKSIRAFQQLQAHAFEFNFPEGFSGQLAAMGLDPNRKTASGLKAAIIREKGSNSEREMAYALYLAGFDVKTST